MDVPYVEPGKPGGVGFGSSQEILMQGYALRRFSMKMAAFRSEVQSAAFGETQKRAALSPIQENSQADQAARVKVRDNSTGTNHGFSLSVEAHNEASRSPS
jgi:hypothetical protein